MAFHQAAGDPCGGRALPRRDDDAEPVVSAAAHGTPAGVHHEADQEAARGAEVRHVGEVGGRGPSPGQVISVRHSWFSDIGYSYAWWGQTGP